MGVLVDCGGAHPVCVCGAVDGGDSGVRHPAASSPVALQRAGGEQQVESFFFISSSSSSAPPTPPSSRLLLSLVVAVVLLRLQLVAEGGVDGDDAAAGANRKFHLLAASVRCIFHFLIKAKLSAKCTRGFFCEPSWKSIIMMKEPFLRFTLFSFSGQTHFQWECYGHCDHSIQICVFKTVRSLDTT